MSTSTKDQNPTINHGGESQNPPKNSICYLWRKVRKNSHQMENITLAPSTNLTGGTNEENLPTALMTSAAPPSLRNIHLASQVVHIEAPYFS